MSAVITCKRKQSSRLMGRIIVWAMEDHATQKTSSMLRLRCKLYNDMWEIVACSWVEDWTVTKRRQCFSTLKRTKLEQQNVLWKMIGIYSCWRVDAGIWRRKVKTWKQLHLQFFDVGDYWSQRDSWHNRAVLWEHQETRPIRPTMRPHNCYSWHALIGFL